MRTLCVRTQSSFDKEAVEKKEKNQKFCSKHPRLEANELIFAIL